MIPSRLKRYIHRIMVSKIMPDMTPRFREIYDKCHKYTITSVERMYALYEATKYVIKNGVKGDIVECGVYKGGSVMVIAYTLLQLGVNNRKIWLYDTYAGMTKPTTHDRYVWSGNSPLPKWKTLARGALNLWDYFPLEKVRANVFSTGYPSCNFKFVKGDVCRTLDSVVPKRISLLRLDTDFYESTKKELMILYPLISRGGVLLVDDYGYCEGARKAVDEYLRGKAVYLHRVDYSGRVLLKP